MAYKVVKIVKKVNLFQDNGKFIPADDITIDTIQKTDGSSEQVAIGWFDKSKNADLFDNCSKIQIAVSQETPSSVTLVAQTEDVDLVNLYKSTEEFTPAQLKEFVKNYANIIETCDFINYPPAGYNSNSITKPAELSPNNDDIKIAIIPLSKVENIASTYLYAWTIKSMVSSTGTTIEIVSNS
jgi:hypothetical protein